MRKALVVVVFVTGLVAIAGCGEKPQAAGDLKDRYAMAFVDGFWVGYKFVKANDFDPATKDLIDVRIEDGTSIIHADRAEILIDEVKQTVALRLHGIVGADPETGSLIEIEEFTTEPGKIRVKAGD
ncbi:MAG: hypothetical protein ACYTF7_07615 [Planctomycetota bacterium]|jgi:hypothetical protein